jgi:pimeloyl-ACP methyl ester carboxylesterase
MDRITTPQGRALAVHRQEGQGPHVVFLGGFRSDMTGTKAAWLHDWARETGRAFLRFDYSGHGASGGLFEDGAISDWREDAEAVIDLAPGPVVLVGSSMGGVDLASDRPGDAPPHRGPRHYRRRTGLHRGRLLGQCARVP